MFNFLKSKQTKRNELLKTQILLWHTSCLSGVNEDILNAPRVKIGTILFFLGSIDAISRTYSLNDKSFFKISIDLLEEMGFPKEITIPVFQNFHINPSRNQFALQSNIAGGNGIMDFYINKNPLAGLILGELIEEWINKSEKLGKDDIFLLGI